jgi:hypothetical protein
MVELQLPKLLTWVRFPSPAPARSLRAVSFLFGKESTARMSNHPTLKDPRIIGWREWLALPQLRIDAVKAKIDTGARSSSLHVDSIDEDVRDGITWLRFSLNTGRRGADFVQCEAPAFDRRNVTDSGGHVTERWFIRTMIRLAGIEWETEINLTNRRNMLFPMLLGRTALSAQFRIDPQLSFVCGRARRRENKTKAAL